MAILTLGMLSGTDIMSTYDNNMNGLVKSRIYIIYMEML